MKKYTGLICFLLCLSVLLCGCNDLFVKDETSEGGLKNDVSEAVSAESPGDDETASETSDPVIPDDPEPEDDFFTRHGQPMMPQPSVIPSFCKGTDTENLYVYDISLPKMYDDEGCGMSLQSAGDYLLMTYWDGERKGRVYSVSLGQLKYGFDLPYDAMDVYVRADGSTVYSQAEMIGADRITVSGFDRNGQKVEPKVIETSCVSSALSRDGKFMAVTTEDRKTVIFNAETGAEVMSIPAAGMGYIQLFADDNGFVVYDGTLEMWKVDPASAEKAPFHSQYIPYMSDCGLYHCYYPQGIMLFDGAEDSDKCFIPRSNWYGSLLDFGFGWSITGTYGEDSYILDFYDLRRSVIAATVEISSWFYDTKALILDNGQVLISAFADGKAIAYLYDLPGLAASEPEGEEINIITGKASELKEKTDALATEIESAFGVELAYGSAGNDFEIWDYVGVVELDPFLIYCKLNDIKDILSVYPENMLRETYELTNKGLKIYMCDRILGLSGSGGLSEAGAVTTEIGGYIVIALNINNDLWADLPHELSHAFDRRISYYDSKNGTNWMEQWESFSEVKKGYAYSYGDYGSLNNYTFFYESNSSRVWFIDNYSRTFPTEDRARIIEYIFKSRDSMEKCFECEHLIDKAMLYSKILRECFPSCNGKKNFWDDIIDRM